MSDLKTLLRKAADRALAEGDWAEFYRLRELVLS